MMSSSRTYISGWSSRTDRNNVTSLSTIHDTGFGSATAASFKPIDVSNSYESIKAQCLQTGSLWEDPDFPAVQQSLFFKTPPTGWPNITWKRPKEICANPQLIVGGASRLDIVQGALGDCWLLAATASLCTNEIMLNKVIPAGQSFESNYAGIFRFNFWYYGRWIEVLVDDRLPATSRKLVYMHSKENNEFWSALLEKAYAKLCGSYEALSGGLTSEALTDFTGGIVHRFELRDKAPKDLWQIMTKGYKKGYLMGCSIDISPGGKMEGQLANGLIEGHAYSVTAVQEVDVVTPRVSGKIALVRVRNPWGDSHEWNGAWSDRSPEWQAVPATERQALGITFDNDGEFWMSFKDFVANYMRLEICAMGPESGDKQGAYSCLLFEGGWKRRVNAGGCRNNIATFWTNPQYQVKVVDPDPDDNDGTGSLIIGLMQKDRRKLRREGLTELTIGYAVYKSPVDCSGTLDSRFFQTNTSSARSSSFINLREICDYHKLAPGNYVIVPSTFEPDQDGDFLLRVYSECEANTARELDNATGLGEVQKDQLNVGKKDSVKNNKDEGRQAFISVAGADGEIDAFELADLLNRIFMKEFTFNGFSTDLTRSMVAMCDRAFRMMDSDKSGYFNSYELRTALNALGLQVSNATFSAIVFRYSDKDGRIDFDDFVSLYIKLKSIFTTFNKKDTARSGSAKFGVDEAAYHNETWWLSCHKEKFFAVLSFQRAR